MDIHICTNQSLRAGMEDIPASGCNLCGHNTVYFDYCGATCWTCGLDIEMPIEFNIKRAREKLFITRREFSELTGYAYSTIKKYDFCGGTKDYVNKSMSVLKTLYSDSKLVGQCKKRAYAHDKKIVDEMIKKHFERQS